MINLKNYVTWQPLDYSCYIINCIRVYLIFSSYIAAYLLHKPRECPETIFHLNNLSVLLII